MRDSMTSANEPAFTVSGAGDAWHLGLTKREWLAGLAMQGAIANPQYGPITEKTMSKHAAGWVAAADAILARLAKGGSDGE